MSTAKSVSGSSQEQPGIQQTPDPITHQIPNRRPMKKAAPQKAAAAFRTISEVADELRVEQHVLRFWETKFSQIKPLKRGGGRRYYRPEDVEVLKNIHHLLYQEGYTIKGVQKLLSAARGGSVLRAEAPPASPVLEKSSLAQAVSRNKDELKATLDELRSMRKLID
jgi:DNA-binding transcriptional MerR regulator